MLPVHALALLYHKLPSLLPSLPAGVEQLSAKERELCASCRLLPAHYLAMKDALLRDCQQNGYLSRQEARSFFRWVAVGGAGLVAGAVYAAKCAAGCCWTSWPCHVAQSMHMRGW